MTSPATARLPRELFLTILGLLDHDTFILAMEVCKEWRSTVQGNEDLWRHHALKRFPPSYERILWDGTRDADSTWEETYKRLACSEDSCYDCALYTLRTIYGDWGPKALCDFCSEGYVQSRQGQRLMTKASAMLVYQLRRKDLQALPKLYDMNREYEVRGEEDFVELYRKQDLRRAAIQRWGGIEEMLKRLRYVPHMYDMSMWGDDEYAGWDYGLHTLWHCALQNQCGDDDMD